MIAVILVSALTVRVRAPLSMHVHAATSNGRAGRARRMATSGETAGGHGLPYYRTGNYAPSVTAPLLALLTSLEYLASTPVV